MKNQKGFVWLPVLLGVLAVLAVSGGAYWYGHQTPAPLSQDTKIDCLAMRLPPDCNAGAKEVPAEKQNAVSVPGMSKYTDSKNGFSIQYPKNFTAYKGKMTIVPANQKTGKGCGWEIDDQGVDVSFSTEGGSPDFGLFVNYGDCMKIEGWNDATLTNVHIGGNNFQKQIQVTDSPFNGKSTISLWSIDHNGITIRFLFNADQYSDAFIFSILSSLTFTS